MSTEAQIEANRENAKLSTGPTTDEGKSISSRNHTKHGLTSQGLIVPIGFESKVAQLDQDLRQTLLPKGPLQEIIFKRILESAWNLERCRHAEAQLSDNDPLQDAKHASHAATIQRYAKSAENSMYKGMRELGKLQSEAHFRQEAFHEDAPQDVSEVTNVTKVASEISKIRKVQAQTQTIELQNEPIANVRRLEAQWRKTQTPPIAA
jgi:hypothetical protein